MPLRIRTSVQTLLNLALRHEVVTLSIGHGGRFLILKRVLVNQPTAFRGREEQLHNLNVLPNSVLRVAFGFCQPAAEVIGFAQADRIQQAITEELIQIARCCLPLSNRQRFGNTPGCRSSGCDVIGNELFQVARFASFNKPDRNQLIP
nr:hypothetical protein [Fuerstiella marisgermanici]